jgi:hypothetical protein
VLALDIPYDGFSDYILELLNSTETEGRKCGEVYQCGNPPQPCTVR